MTDGLLVVDIADIRELASARPFRQRTFRSRVRRSAEGASFRSRLYPVVGRDPAGRSVVRFRPDPGDPASVEVVLYENWLVGRARRGENPGVWLTTTDDSHVVMIEEQYVP